MTFTLDAHVSAVLAAGFERSGPPPALPTGDVASRRAALDAMLGYFNRQAQPVASKGDISDHSVVMPSGGSRAAVLYLHGGGMITGSVAIFDGLVSRHLHPGVPHEYDAIASDAGVSRRRAQSDRDRTLQSL